MVVLFPLFLPERQGYSLEVIESRQTTTHREMSRLVNLYPQKLLTKQTRLMP